MDEPARGAHSVAPLLADRPHGRRHPLRGDGPADGGERPAVAEQLATAAALALLGAAPAGAADLPDPKVTTSGGQSVIEFVSHTESESFAPKGGAPVSGEPDRAPETSSTAHCVVTVTFANGTMKIEGDTVFSENSSFDVPIIGGTGAYAGAHGKVKVVDVNEKDSKVTLTYTTKAADSDDQVSVTPAGGAATGGGSSPAGVGSSLLALGALGVGAGAILLTACRKVSRRTT